MPDLKVNAPQKGALVGDEAVQEARQEPTVAVNDSPDKAQVVAKRAPDADQVQVHEVAVQLDHVVTDPSSPEAAQIPDAGRGSLDLPIHELGNGTPEDQFAAEDDDTHGENAD